LIVVNASGESALHSARIRPTIPFVDT